MSRTVLGELGLPPRPTSAQVAAAVAFRLPVELGGRGGGRSPGELAAAGGPGAPEEILALLRLLFPEGEVDRSGPLPRLRTRGGVVGPGLPVPVTGEPAAGPDGWYRLLERNVLRESAGRERGYAEGLAGTRALLLFTPEARWLLGGGSVVVEDVFSRVEAPLRRAWAEGFLLRRLRLGEGLLRHPVLGEQASPVAPRITVWRALELLAGAPWHDPERVLRVREGVEAVHRRGDRLELTLETGGRLLLRVEEAPHGWRAELVEGEYPVQAVELTAHGHTLRSTWTVRPDLDLLETGLRARLAFDLTSDLVRLAGAVPGRPPGAGQKV